jgi:hypothetical protein
MGAMEKNEEKVKIRGIKKTQNSTFLKLCIVCFFLFAAAPSVF